MSMMQESATEVPRYEAQSPLVVHFGLFEVDLKAQELRKQGRRIKLQTQPFQILRVLLEHPGVIVTREELCRRLWPGDTFVDFDHSLNTAVRRLREALSDSSENPVFIETLQRQGYRFIAPLAFPEIPRVPSTGRTETTLHAPLDVTERDEIGAALPIAQTTTPSSKEISHRSLLLFVTGGVIAGAVLAMATVNFLTRAGFPAVKADRVRSLVVLPLQNLSLAPDQDYLADGMTDELIASLAKVKSLRVVPRTTSMGYKGTHKPLSQIAHDLNVDAVVEGTVMRSGNRIRITTELVEIAADRALWAETYESSLDDVLSLQQRVASAIVNNIQVQLTPQERQNLKPYQPSNPEAYEDYLRGRYYWNKRSQESLTKAIDYFEKATTEDPNYALAYAGLADCYGIIGAAIVGTVPAKEVAPKAEAAARRALELDPGLAEAQTSLATVMLNYRWDWSGAESGFRHSIEMDPALATAHQRYSLYLIAMGRTEESMAEIQQALKLDPQSVSINFSEGWRLYMARKYDQAIQQLQSTIEMDPSFALPHIVLGQSYEEKGLYAQATAELQKAASLSRNSAPSIAALARVQAVSGHPAEARAGLEQLQKQAHQQYVSPFYLAQVYAGLGDANQAASYLEQAVEDRSNSMIFLRVDPEFDSVRSNPHFQRVLQELQL